MSPLWPDMRVNLHSEERDLIARQPANRLASLTGGMPRSHMESTRSTGVYSRKRWACIPRRPLRGPSFEIVQEQFRLERGRADRTVSIPSSFLASSGRRTELCSYPEIRTLRELLPCQDGIYDTVDRYVQCMCGVVGEYYPFGKSTSSLAARTRHSKTTSPHALKPRAARPVFPHFGSPGLRLSGLPAA